MKRIILVFTLLFTLFLSGCHKQWATEKEESDFWSDRVNRPAYEVLFREKKIDPALRVFDSLRHQTQLSSPFISAARYSLVASYYYFFTTNNEATGRYIDSALAIFRNPNLQEQYPRTYVGYLLFGGSIALRLADYSKANNYYFRAKQLTDQYLDPCERSGFIYNMAMVSYKQQNFTQSAAYFKQAYEDQATCPVQTGGIILQQQEIQSNIGLCMVHLQQYDSALVYFNRTLEMANQNKDSLGPQNMDKIYGVEYGNIAKVYLTIGRLSEAEALFKKSIVLNSRPGYEQHDALSVQVQLAELYHKQQRFPEMWDELQAIRKNLDTLPDLDMEAEWRKLMFNYYRNTGQPLSELKHYKNYISLRDSINDSKRQLMQADVSSQLKQKEQELQITILRKNNQLDQIYLWVAITLSIMAMLIISLIYQNYRRSKKNIKVLMTLNQQVNRQKLDLEKANKEKDHILQVVAHDLRSPIGITAYMADLILMDEQNDNDRTSLQMIKEASEQALSLTNELLGIKTGKEGKDTKERIDLIPLMATTIQMLQYKAAEKGQTIEVIRTDEPLWVFGQPEKLHRVISNILGNAIKFSPLQSYIMVNLKKEGSCAVITIADQGIGIPGEKQPYIFDRFTSASLPGTSGEQSLGLGLSICKEIVEEHNGTIHFQSTKGKGTTFYVQLPIS